MKRLGFLLSLIAMPLFAQDILPLRERATLIDQIQKDRIENLLPQLMEEQDIDLWVLITQGVQRGPCGQNLIATYLVERS